MLGQPLNPNAVHRLAKSLLDSHAAIDAEDAEARLRALSLRFHIDAEEAGSPVHQATLLTAVALARRAFLGGVAVSGALDVPVAVPSAAGPTLGDAARDLGAVAEVGAGPIVYIGGAARPQSAGFALRTLCAGWRGGIVPAHATSTLEGAPTNVLAGVLAAGLAINEAFLALTVGGAVAGRRSVGLSMWSPDALDWRVADDAPELAVLPSRLWLIGLGHLGQAYLWCLGLLPYGCDAGRELVLQDFDRVTEATWTTSILTPAPTGTKAPPHLGIPKTRLLAAWAEERGFATRICERAFDINTKRRDDEPTVALCGVDNAAARRALDGAGFGFIVSAGLGSGHGDFRSLRVHTLPAARRADEIWPSAQSDTPPTGGNVDYDRLVAAGKIDQCGAAVLAGIAVGAPFVGAVAAVLVLSEVLRLLHGGRLYAVIDADLTSLEHRSAVRQTRSFSCVNPGFTPVQ